MDESLNLRKNVANGLYWCLAVLMPTFLLKLIAGIVLLGFCVKRPHKMKWIFLFIYEILVLIMACCYTHYYDALPGSGIMPGLTYIGEVMTGMLFSVAFFLLLFISLMICLLRKQPE